MKQSPVSAKRGELRLPLSPYHWDGDAWDLWALENNGSDDGNDDDTTRQLLNYNQENPYE